MSDLADRLGVSPPVVTLIFALVTVQVCLAIDLDASPEADEAAPSVEVDGLSDSEWIRLGMHDLYGATSR